MRQCEHHGLHVSLHQSLQENKTQHAPSTLGLGTWSRCRLGCSSSRLSVLLKSNVLFSQHQKPKRSIVTTLYGRTQQNHCVQLNHRQQPCMSRPPIPLCDSRLKPCPVPTPLDRSSGDVSSERVSHLSYCTEHLFPILTSSHE